MTKGIDTGGFEPADLGDLGEVADRAGLQRIGVRPSFGTYVAQLWQVRHFSYEYAKTRTYRRNENTYLGQFWNVLNPLLFAGVYYVVFGLILSTNRGIENFPAFLVIGVTIFQYMANSLTSGSTAITSNNGLIRSLAFPRAALPLAIATSEVLNLLPGLGVAVFAALITGEVPTWEWLWLLVVLPLVVVFSAGMSLFMARLVSVARDTKNLIPHVTRVLRYGSGVFFLITAYAGHGIIGTLLAYQPFAAGMLLVRGSLMSEFTVSPLEVAVMAGWALLSFTGGLVYFWRGEGTYGRQ